MENNSPVKRNKLYYSTLLNIDSSFRNLYPKNICRTDNVILPNNPITLEKNSNIVTFNYPNHNLKVGDYVAIQNVEGISKILSNSVYLINNFKYAIIVFGDNTIDINYRNVTDELYINIEVYGEQIEKKFINNIPFNLLTGVKKALIGNDIPKDYLNIIQSINIENVGLLSNTDILNKQLLFFELPYEYISIINNFYNINQVFKISYLHIGGIKLGYLNANYPINNYNYQSSYMVSNVIDIDNFQIALNYSSYGNLKGGGNNVQVLKVINSITGYPDADNYVINLKKSFNNVTNIELVSTEFPYVDIIVKKDINDKLYWKNIEDGDTVYKVQIEEGFYTANFLLDKLKSSMNSVERSISTPVTPVYNYFDITIESNIQKITFKPYNLTKLPNSLSVRLVNIGSSAYYILNIGHPNNIVEIGDTITISESGTVTTKEEVNFAIQILSIDSSYFNKDHKVYAVNLENQTYDIILGKKEEIKTNIVIKESGGGENVIVKSKSKVSFLFDRTDTIGQILGFKNVGDIYSVTDYKSEITNQDNYINSNNLNSVGNEIAYLNGFFNFSGKYNYFLMYLNDIEYIYSNNNLPSTFSKILLSGNPGDVLFNTFVPQPNNIYSKSFPISTLTEINVRFIYPDGNRVNFRNINHSFTLRITEERIQNDDTYLNSQTISVAEEFKRIKN